MSPQRKDTLMSGYARREFESTENFERNLDEIAREGARRMLLSVLEAEVADFLGRHRYERGEDFRGYRNGYGKERKVALGSGPLNIRAPRVRESRQPFKSEILKSYQRQSDNLKVMTPQLYLHGLATGDLLQFFYQILFFSEATYCCTGQTDSE